MLPFDKQATLKLQKITINWLFFFFLFKKSTNNFSVSETDNKTIQVTQSGDFMTKHLLHFTSILFYFFIGR